jgi:hypothetical protein
LSSGAFYKDFDGAQKYRHESLQYFRQALAVDEELDADQRRPLSEYPPPSPYPTTESFRPVADMFRKGYSVGERYIDIHEKPRPPLFSPNPCYNSTVLRALNSPFASF